MARFPNLLPKYFRRTKSIPYCPNNQTTIFAALRGY
jgi:hypothetical protein